VHFVRKETFYFLSLLTILRPFFGVIFYSYGHVVNYIYKRCSDTIIITGNFATAPILTHPMLCTIQYIKCMYCIDPVLCWFAFTARTQALPALMQCQFVVVPYLARSIHLTSKRVGYGAQRDSATRCILILFYSFLYKQTVQRVFKFYSIPSYLKTGYTVFYTS
jgi:hypothetical protein